VAEILYEKLRPLTVEGKDNGEKIKRVKSHLGQEV
jgi:hypothetical protein